MVRRRCIGTGLGNGIVGVARYRGLSAFLGSAAARDEEFRGKAGLPLNF